ncbi:MAG TPA: cytochrome c3 family protein [Thermoanaerobaculia bacterium]|nr:cytochrome c3 family protein [Thermoanaerobaculia bacterium]
MAQIFPRWTHELPLLLAAAIVVAVGLLVGGVWYYFSPEYTDVGYRPVQPVAYSHKLHAGELEIDCLYCHATVDRAPAAVVPPTRVCMNCHHVVKRDSPALAAIRESSTSGRPMQWVRVHNLPDFAFFDHRPHLRAGVGCSTCHGRIDQMEVVTLARTLSMSWCLDCHRNPDPYLRLDHELTTMDWSAPKDQLESAARIKAAKRLEPPLDCTGCHR